MKKRPGIFVLSAFFVFVLSLLCYANSASAYVAQNYNGNPVKWSTDSVTFSVNTSGGPEYAISAIQTGMASWTNASTAYLTLVYGGSTSSSGVNNADGYNKISFGEPGSGYLGVARFRYNASGQLTDCDIILRINHSWSESTLGDVAAHEFGHCIGLDHTSDSSTTMYPTVRQGASTLSQDDINGISFLYPSGSPSASPSGSATEASTAAPSLDDMGKVALVAFSAVALAFYLRRMRGGRGGVSG